MTIGVLGGGQLCRMLAQSAKPLGHSVVFIDPKADACAAQFAEHIIGNLDDPLALDLLLQRCDVLTYESENMPMEQLRSLQGRISIFPSLDALAASQDRLTEKDTCNRLKIGTARYWNIDSDEALESAVTSAGCPCILKTRRMGYDGKGQLRLRSDADIPEAKKMIASQPCILEAMVEFEKEVSVIACRSQQGDIGYYPLTENVHKEGILRVSTAPAAVSEETANDARAKAKVLLEHFDYVGTLAIEFFVLSDGSLLVNEMAPRVHNSGHWTIEGTRCGQFENHVRAISGLGLGPCDLVSHSAMINIIGSVPPLDDIRSMTDVHVHLYGKSERPGRKIGHITVCKSDVNDLRIDIERIMNIVDSAK